MWEANSLIVLQMLEPGLRLVFIVLQHHRSGCNYRQKMTRVSSGALTTVSHFSRDHKTSSHVLFSPVLFIANNLLHSLYHTYYCD